MMKMSSSKVVATFQDRLLLAVLLSSLFGLLILLDMNALPLLRGDLIKGVARLVPGAFWALAHILARGENPNTSWYKGLAFNLAPLAVNTLLNIFIYWRNS